MDSFVKAFSISKTGLISSFATERKELVYMCITFNKAVVLLKSINPNPIQDYIPTSALSRSNGFEFITQMFILRAAKPDLPFLEYAATASKVLKCKWSYVIAVVYSVLNPPIPSKKERRKKYK